MVAPPSTHGAAFQPSLLRPGEGGRPPVPRGTGVGPSLPSQEAGRWSCHRRFERLHVRRIRRRRATGSRRPDCPRRVGVANQSDTHSRVVPRGRGSRATLAKARLASVAWGSPSKSRAWLSPQLYREHARTTETVVGALRSHVYLRHSATTCGLELAHAPLLAYTHTLDCHRL